MRVDLVGPDLVVRVRPDERLGGLFFRSTPRISVDDVEWVASVGKLHVDDACQFVRFSLLGSVNVAASWSCFDMHARSNYDEGSAYVQVRYRKPAYVVKARAAGRWSLFLFSHREGEDLLAEICRTNPRVQRRLASEVIPYRLH